MNSHYEKISCPICASKNFKIFSDNVLFNKKNQTAESTDDSLFFSDKTKIKSEGFTITNNGNTIMFNGKTKLTTK